jgi:pimeloyl-ACP methyl ester carboxylesterase
MSATSQAGLSAAGGTPNGYGPQGRSAWLDVDWREHQRWLNVDGQAVNLVELGPERPPAGAGTASSKPIVFVHGLSGSWPNWLEQLPVLAAGHRVLALDLPGFGHSPMPSQEISISGYARLLDRVLDQLEIDAAAVVGNSMGGFIGAELAIAFPQRVERLVLVSAAGLSTFGEPRVTRALPALRRLERITAAGAAWLASKSDVVAQRPRLREATLALVVAHPGRLPAALAAEQLRGAGTPGFIQALDAVIDYDVRDRLPEIACPTLIVWGDRDRLISVSDADVFADLIPDSRKVIFSDTGHMAMLERPAAFNSLLEQFLAE